MKLEQYRYLHEELLYLRRIKDTLQLAAYSSFGVILSVIYSIDNPSPFLFLIPFVVIIPLATNNIGKRDSVIRLATYIQVMIEEGNDEINWETDIDQILFKETALKSYRLRLRKIQNSSYSLLGLLSLILFVNEYFSKIRVGINYDTIIGLVIILFGIIVLLLIYNKMKEVQISRESYKREWLHIKANRKHAD